MKVKLSLVLICLGFLSSCATMSGPQNSITQESNQTELNLAFNTAKDGVTQSWDADGVSYHLRTTETHVNGQGVPCRHFNLDISRSFYSGKTLTGTACRYDNKWTDISQNNA